VTDDRTEALLQTVVRREARSLLQYVSEAFPWETAEERGAVAQLQQAAAEERDAVAALTRAMQRKRLTPPYLGAFPQEFTTINFVSLDHLLPQLVDAQRRAIAALERDRDALEDPDLRAGLDKVLEMKRRHLKTLESLAAKPQAAA